MRALDISKALFLCKIMKVSIQGIKGAFHEEAARLHFSDKIEIVEQLTFEEVISSVETGNSDAGIMAIENTISGTIHSNFEWIKNSKLTIVGEVYLQIQQYLAVNKGVKLHDLVEVESHYMAINQCREFFRKYPKIKLVDSEDTALSMKSVSENKLATTGAIGSKLAAGYYDLEILGESIETNKKNYTRFFVLQPKPREKEVIDKASLQFVLKNKRGSLARALEIIDRHHIDLSKIESLPIIGEPWHYQFYIDVLFDSTGNYHKMLEELKSQLESLTILGEYRNQIKKLN